MHISSEALFCDNGMIKPEGAPFAKGQQTFVSGSHGMVFREVTITPLKSWTLECAIASGIYITTYENNTVELTTINENTTRTYPLNPNQSLQLKQFHFSWEALAGLCQSDIATTKSTINTWSSQGVRIAVNGLNDILKSLRASQNQFEIQSSLYQAAFSLLSALQIQNHLKHCDQCHDKVLRAQNLVESAPTISLDKLCHQVELSSSALNNGFLLFNQLTLDEYRIDAALSKSPGLLRNSNWQQVIQSLETDCGIPTSQVNQYCQRRFGHPIPVNSTLH